MKHGIMKYLKMFLAFVMVFSLVQIERVRAEGEGVVCKVDLDGVLNLELNENGYKVTKSASNENEKIQECAEYDLYQTNPYPNLTEISFSKGNYKIKLNNEKPFNLSAIQIASGANVTLIVAGENSISEGNLTINIASGATLSIQGNGTLYGGDGLSVIGNGKLSSINLNGKSIKGDIKNSTVNVTGGSVAGDITNSTLTVDGGTVSGSDSDNVEVTINKGLFLRTSITGKLTINGGATYITNGLNESIDLTMTNGFLSCGNIDKNNNESIDSGILVVESIELVKPVIKGTNVTINTGFTLSSEWEPLEIPESTTLVNDADINVSGKIKNYGTIDNKGNLQLGYNGEIKNYGTIDNKGKLELLSNTTSIHNYGTIEGNEIEGSGTFTNHTFIISTKPKGIENLPYGTPHTLGVEIEDTLVPDNPGTVTYQWFKGNELIPNANQATYDTPTDLAVGTYTYSCEITKDGYSEKSDEATVVVKKSGTKFDGGIQLDNTSYTYGDMFTVKVKPVSNGQVVSTFSMTAPTVNQMAIFKDDKQVSEAVYANADGIYEMKVDSTLLGAGSHTLKAKYMGNTNMAEVSSDFTVTVNKKPLTIIADDKTIKINEALPTFAYKQIGELVTGHRLSAPLNTQTVPDLTQKGTYNIVFDSISITDGAGNDVTRNYDITSKNATLTIAEEVYTLSLSANDGGSVEGAGTYAKGKEVPVKATPNTGYEFDKWEVVSPQGLQILNEAQTTFTMPNSNVEIKAHFKEIENIELEKVLAPNVSMVSGTYTSNLLIKLSSGTEGSKIYYTLDDSSPATSSDLYSKPIKLTGKVGESKSYIVKAMAVKEGMEDSEIAVYKYTINLPKEEKPVDPEPTPDPEPELPTSPTYPEDRPTYPSKPDYKEETVKNEDVTISGEFDGKVEIKEPNKSSDSYKNTIDKVSEKDTIVVEIEIKIPDHKGDIDIEVKVDEKYNGKDLTIIYGNGKETVETIGKVVDGKLTFTIGDMKGTITVLVVEKYTVLDLSPYADGLLQVYPNSRVTSITLTENGFKLAGYAFVKDMPMDYINQHKLVREIVFVNEENTSVEYAYRQSVKATPKGSFLTSNKNLNPTGKVDYTYATYEIEIKYPEIMNYKKNMSALKVGKYRIYVRVSDGKHAYLMPLVDRVLSDGSTLTLPSNMELVDSESRELRLNK